MTEYSYLVLSIVAVCGIAIVYHHFIFPLFLRRFAGEPTGASEYMMPNDLPTMTIVVAAYNEGAFVADKIRNLASLIYPADKLSVIVVCDGCTDNTVRQAAQAASEPEYRDLSLVLLDNKTNRGKVAVLNETLRGVSSDIVCLTDVSAWMSVDALTRAAWHFQNPEIGVVAGTYHLFKPGSNGEDAYWRYQRIIKQGEAAIGSPLGVHGACYFMRTSAISPLPDDTINDDFVLPMLAVRDGHRAVYDTDIVGLEMEPTDLNSDFLRRCRIAAGNTQQLMRLFGLMHLRYGGIALSFASGKALRVIIPYLMLLSFVSCAIFAPYSTLCLAALIIQVIGYAGAVVRAVAIRENRFRLLDLLYYLVAGHTANFLGSIRYVCGLHNGHWSKISQIANRR